MNWKAVSGTLLTTLLVGMLMLASNIQPTTSQEAPLRFDVKIEPQYPTVNDIVNVTVVLLDVPSISYAFGFGPLIRVNNEFSVDINVSIPWILLWAYVGNVTHTYGLGKLSKGSYNFSATVHYWHELPDGTWPSKSSDYSYGESFAVSPLRRSLVTMEVVPHYSYVHDGFATINIVIEALDGLVGIGFKLAYANTLLQVTNVTEGPFMQNPAWNLHGTTFIQFVEVDPAFGPVVFVGDLLNPDDDGVWAASADGNGTLATIQFQASNTMSQGHIWTRVGLSSEQADFCSSGYICLLEEAKNDLNQDGTVNMKDLGMVAKASGTRPGDLRWDAACDINCDFKVDMKDIGAVAKHFGKTYEVPPDAGNPPQ